MLNSPGPTDHLSVASSLETALATLFSPDTTNHQRLTANAWLVEFQQNSCAWQACFDLLAITEQGHPQDFAAQTLRLKVQRHLSQLPAEALRPLRDSLAGCLKAVSASAFVIKKQLSLALASLAVQWEDWTDALQYISMQATTSFAALRLSTVTQPLLALSLWSAAAIALPSHMPVLTAVLLLVDAVSSLTPSTAVLVLTFLPEESCEERYISVTDRTRRHGDTSTSRTKVASWSSSVLGWLQQWLQASPLPFPPAALLDCFTAWVRLGCLYDVSLLHSKPLIDAVLANAASPSADHGKSAAGAFEAIVEHSPADAVPLLFAAASQLPEAAAEALLHKREQQAEACCRIFSAFCTWNFPLWASASPEGYTLRNGLLHLLTIGAADEEEDMDEPLIVHSLQAWSDIAEFADDAHLLHPASHGPQMHGDISLMPPDEARECFCTFVHMLLQTRQEHFVQLDSEDMLDTPFLRAAGDALSAACRFIGARQYLAVLQHMASNSAASMACRLQLALHAVRAAEEALLHHLSEAEEGAPVVAASLAELFGAAHGALRAAPALFQLRLAALMPMSQLADALLRHLCVDDDGAASASAQDLLRVMLDLASASLSDARLARPASAALASLCEAAAVHAVPLPPSGLVTSLLTLVDSATDLGVEQNLITAAGHCLAAPRVTCSISAESRQQAVRHLLQPLRPALQQLLQAVAAQGGQQMRSSATTCRVALRALARLRALLSHATTWLGQGGASGAPGEPSSGASSGQTAVQEMAQAWPEMQAALAAPVPEAVREDIAKCCALAMRAAPGAFSSAIPAFTSAAAACFAAPGGSHFARPLCQALELFGEEPRARASLLQALQALLGLPQVLHLTQWRAGDACPDLAQGTVVLVMTAVRLLAPEGGEPWPWEVQQLVQQGLATAAACAPCSHKDVASAALSCLDALVGQCAQQAPVPQDRAALLLAAAPQVLQGLVGALLAPSPLARVFKVTSVLASLAALQLPPSQGGSSMVELMLGWLSANLDGLTAGVTPVSSKEATLAEWGPALRAASDNQSTESARVTSDNVHRLKLAVRSFAERHQQQQVVLA